MDRDQSAGAIALVHSYATSGSVAAVTTTLTKGTAPTPPNARGIRIHSITKGWDETTPTVTVDIAACGVRVRSDSTTRFAATIRDSEKSPVFSWDSPINCPFGADGTLTIKSDIGAVATNAIVLIIVYSYY